VIRLAAAAAAGAALGWVARSELAVRRDAARDAGARARATAALARRDRRRRAASERNMARRSQLGWLHWATATACAALAPGERPVGVTVRAAWLDGTTVLVSVDHGDREATRAMEIPGVIHVHGLVPVQNDLPDPGHETWG
jgi:hypothetical protein